MSQTFASALLRQIVDYRNRTGPYGFQLERFDHYIALATKLLDGGTLELTTVEMVQDAEDAVMLMIRSLQRAKRNEALRRTRKGIYESSPGSVLNAYRDGDLTFDECVELLYKIPPAFEPAHSHEKLVQGLHNIELRIKGTVAQLLGERDQLWAQFHQKYLQGFTVGGSHGTLICDPHGYVVEYRPDPVNSTEYADIVQVNVSEAQQHYGRDVRSLDILLVGYWDKDENYISPDEYARKLAAENHTLG